MGLHYKKGVPSKINADFHARRIDAAFISSISAKKSSFVPLGIIAKKEVTSVLVIEGKDEDDIASQTSNTLKKILNLKGKVLIGDSALEYYLNNSDYVDMAQLWYQKQRVPFVFALLAYHNHKDTMQKLAKHFTAKPTKIPQYILKKASQNSNIAPQDILDYLKLISYKLDYKAQRGLKRFWAKSSYGISSKDG